ncbi:uncharacterized protein LOC111862023 isoform X2 [Cryptotermes secundus]|uniref:uncharacterized protein LOC111862023 isoform X2 n=1 Tax=Cryptotermes secundus TaxID=105785 RepID=UPI000CD7D1FF|nr:uncharacterized protein LOC111862023 isoform X2 [Cryptotermes secundus]
MTVAQAKRQSLIDLVVALVSLPLLVVFGLMLESNMRGDWTNDPEMRWHVLGLGLALLFVSLMVCGYITHRLGICIWAASQEPYSPHYGSDDTRPSTSSKLHLVVGDELPPSYESVVSCGKPPPYHSTMVFDEKRDHSGAHAAAVLKQATG